MTARYSRAVTSYFPIQKPFVNVTRVCGPSASHRPRSVSGLPIVNLPGGIHTMFGIVCTTGFVTFTAR